MPQIILVALRNGRRRFASRHHLSFSSMSLGTFVGCRLSVVVCWVKGSQKCVTRRAGRILSRTWARTLRYSKVRNITARSFRLSIVACQPFDASPTIRLSTFFFTPTRYKLAEFLLYLGSLGNPRGSRSIFRRYDRRRSKRFPKLRSVLG